MTALTETPIAVIGAGSWGTALALVLAHNNKEVRLWGHERLDMQTMRETRENKHYLPGYSLPNNMLICHDLKETLDSVSDVLVVVPSHAFRDIIQAINPLTTNPLRLAWGTKGLDPQSGFTLDSVAQEILGDDTPLAVLSGPSFATEVAANLPTAVTLASQDEQFCEDLILRFHTPHFRLYKSTDITGVELCGVVKNVLAIGAGINDGLKLGANARSALITRGFAELARLLEVLGGSQQTLLSLAGFGDTILSCMTDESRNRRFGLAVGSGVKIPQAIEQIGQVVEGYKNTKQLYRLGQKYSVDMPIVEAIYQVLYQELAPTQAAEKLMGRDSTGQWG